VCFCPDRKVGVFFLTAHLTTLTFRNNVGMNLAHLTGETAMLDRVDLSTETERARYLQLLAEAQSRLRDHNAAKAEREAARRQQACAWMRGQS
jgi:hypothetical protein